MKRILRFDHFFLISGALLAISGCGANKSLSDTAFSTSAVLAAPRDLTTDERTIATRICYAYQSKNTSFKLQTYFGATFVFNNSFKECNSTLANYEVSGILSSSTTTPSVLIYSTSSTAKFNKTVQTAQAGFLSQLCTKIQNNLPIKNTVVDGSSSVQIAFSSGAMDSYTLQYFTNAKITMAETFKVRTQFNIVANQILGMDETYTKQQVCTSDTTKYTELNQVYSYFTQK